MQKSERITLDRHFLNAYIPTIVLEEMQTNIDKAAASLWDKKCPGQDMLGWLDLPMRNNEEEITRIMSKAHQVSEADHLIVVGIGGSYMGARSVIELLKPSYFGLEKVIYFGHHLGTDYANQLLDYLKGKNFYVNVISKSGTTTEPAVAFRLLFDRMQELYTEAELQERIIITADPDPQVGALRKIAKEKGYDSFELPPDVGGRFSVLTPVGLFPIACVGLDIAEILNGAKSMAEWCRQNNNVLENHAVTYAAARYLLFHMGKMTEILSYFDTDYHFFGEWWKQLFGESEGKDFRGIFPTTASYTTDLHSLGQFVQQGTRNIFETFLITKDRTDPIVIPKWEDDFDGLNYLANKTLSDVNHQAFRGTFLAHFEGGVPCLKIDVPEKTEFYLGQLIYFFEYAIAISGLLLGVNPFDQPGVEKYKNNMFALLGKPKHEHRKAILEQKLNSNH